MRVAVIDDWQGIAPGCADWAPLQARAEVVFFQDTLPDPAAALADFDVIMIMRERTPFPAGLIEALPRLRMIAATGHRTASLDMAACTRQGIVVSAAQGGGSNAATAELALGLLIAAFRHIPQGDAAIRAGGFQGGVPPGDTLDGRTLGIIGLGRLGGRLAGYARALGMTVLAWSQNLTPEAAAAAGAERVEKAALLERSDAVSLHLVLSDRSRGILGAADLARMRPGAVLVNTSRGPLVDEPALLAAVQSGRIRAALDVYDREPLPPDSPWRTAPNTVLTPHLGYVTADTMQGFYREGVENVLAFLDGAPIRLLNPEVLTAGS
jgi:phosphoglycerate dehydrogenase-like enzyme